MLAVLLTHAGVRLLCSRSCPTTFRHR